MTAADAWEIMWKEAKTLKGKIGNERVPVA